jgi:hypothetical protein
VPLHAKATLLQLLLVPCILETSWPFFKKTIFLSKKNKKGFFLQQHPRFVVALDFVRQSHIFRSVTCSKKKKIKIKTIELCHINRDAGQYLIEMFSSGVFFLEQQVNISIDPYIECNTDELPHSR